MASAHAGIGPVRPIDPIAAARTRTRLECATGAPWLHEEAARRMAERLPLMRQAPQRVVDWWGHAGGSAAALIAALPRARIEQHGLCAGPQAASSPWWRRWWPDLLAMPASASPGADMVWANMLLHHEPDPLGLMRQWHAQLAQDGFLMFSTLGPGSLTSLRSVYRRQTWGSPMADLVDMHDLGDQLIEAGFADPVMDQEIVRLTWSSPQAALQELRSLGSNLNPSRHAGLRTPRWQRRLEQALAQQAEQGDGLRVALDFELVYGHAFKPPPRHPLAAETRIDLSDLRQTLQRKRNEP